MPGKHRNRTVPVYGCGPQWRDGIRYFVTEARADELVKAGRAFRIDAGLEIVGCKPANAVGIEAAALAQQFSGSDTAGYTVEYIRSRSPFRWASGNQ